VWLEETRDNFEDHVQPIQMDEPHERARAGNTSVPDGQLSVVGKHFTGLEA